MLSPKIIFLLFVLFSIGSIQFIFGQQLESPQIIDSDEISTSPEPTSEPQKNDEEILWDYTELAKVTIPSVAGALTTYITTGRWQKYRNKVEMVKEILSAYQSSAKKFAVIQDTFAFSMILKYADQKNAEDLLSGNKIEFTIKEFPTEAKLLPKQAFVYEYQNIEKELLEIRNNASVYLTKVRLFTDQTDLQNKFQQIQRCNIYTWLKVQNMYNAITLKEFANAVREYQQSFTETKKQIATLENDLVNLKIHKKPF